jgi:ribA/ribD-fused uncharacterized protein
MPRLKMPVHEAAVQILKETKNNAVMFSDRPLLFAIAERAGMKVQAHYVESGVLDHLARKPGILVMGWTTVGLGPSERKVRIFRMPEENTINYFTGHADFLSNFYPGRVRDEHGIWYDYVENAFQAAKTSDVQTRMRVFSTCTPASAKKAGRRVKLAADWEERKVSVMKWFLHQKFQHTELRRRLLATGTAQLIEGNHWGDQYWGVCNGKGLNMLGKLLMEVREEIRKTR